MSGLLLPRMTASHATRAGNRAKASAIDVMLDLAGALQAGTTAIGLLKEFNEVNKYDKATLKLKVAEVANPLLKLQTALGEAQSELSKERASRSSRS